MKLLSPRPRFRAARTFAAAAFAFGVLAACASPNGAGVQEFGTITGRVVDAKSQQPVAALINVGSTITSQTDSQGGFVLNQVPIGQQSVTINAVGWVPKTITVSILKGQESPLGVISLDSVISGR